MKKKVITSKKTTQSSSQKKKPIQFSYYHYIIITALVLLAIPTTRFISTAATTPHVLGAHTYLAQSTGGFNWNDFLNSVNGGTSNQGSTTQSQSGSVNNVSNSSSSTNTNSGGSSGSQPTPIIQNNTVNQNTTNTANSTGSNATATQKGSTINQYNTSSSTNTNSGGSGTQNTNVQQLNVTGTQQQNTVSNTSTQTNSNSNSSGNSTSGNTQQTTIIDTSATNSSSSLGTDAVVDCTGPDGKHSTTTFADCITLNKTWNKSSFNFTILQPATSTEATLTTFPSISPTVSGVPSQNGGIPAQIQQQINQIQQQQVTQVTEQNTNKQIDLMQPGTTLDFNTQNEQGNVEQGNVTVQLPDGTSVQPVIDQAIAVANSALKDKNISIQKTADNTFSIQKAGVDVVSQLPVSVNLENKTLTVTTPQGKESINLLPDEAVNGLKRTGVLSEVQSQANIVNNQAVVSNQANLTTLDEKPVYEIQGVANKKLLGLFPVSYAKTAFVSTDTGDVVKTQQSIWSQLLEQFSL